MTLESKIVLSKDQAFNEIDLTINGSLPTPLAALYDDLALSLRQEFVAFIGSVYQDEKNHLDWWLEGPASRNHELSQLYHKIVCLVLIKKLLRDNIHFDLIIVDDLDHLKLIQSLLAQTQHNAIARCSISRWQRSIKLVRRLFSPYRSMATLFLEWLIIRSSNRFRTPTISKQNPLIIIDTFSLEGHVEKDRYYPKLYELAPAELKHAIRFVPQFFDFNFPSLWRAAKFYRTRPEKYLLKEDLISYKDFFWCISHWWRLQSLSLTEASFSDIDIKNLIRSELTSAVGYRCAVRGLLNYKFSESLFHKNIAITKSIDWFENHPLDRGWNFGFNKFYPQTERVGYVGFYTAFQSTRPSNHEHSANILPSKFFTIGEGLNQDFREFNPQCIIETAPAYRYANFLNITDFKYQNTHTVLVVLPYDRSISALILNAIIDYAPHTLGYRYLVKPHPAISLDSIGGANLLTNLSVEIVSGTLLNWLASASIVITGGQTTAALESIANAVPTIILLKSGYYLETVAPLELPEFMCARCNDLAQLENLLLKYMTNSEDLRKRRCRTAKLIRDRFFSTVNTQTTENFLND